jgi:serine/threonine protein kinase
MEANRRKHRISPMLKTYLCRKLIKAVHFFHKVNGLAHLDLKPDNIVLTESLELALIDFGHAAPLRKPKNQPTGTYIYNSPEVVRTISRRNFVYVPERADIYSLGICLFIVLFQSMPYGKPEMEDDLYSLLCLGRPWDFFSAHHASGFSMAELSAIWSCMSMKPTSRPLSDELLKDSFLCSEVISTEVRDELIFLLTPSA